MRSRYGHAIRHCAARRPSRNKEKGWRSKFPGVGWMEVFQKGPPAASICGAGTQPTALRFRSCGRAPSIHRTTARAPSYHHDAIRHRTASAFRPLPPGQDDDGLLASRASRNTTTPPYILPPAKTDVVADMSGQDMGTVCPPSFPSMGRRLRRRGQHSVQSVCKPLFNASRAAVAERDECDHVGNLLSSDGRNSQPLSSAATALARVRPCAFPFPASHTWEPEDHVSSGVFPWTCVGHSMCAWELEPLWDPV